MKTISTLMMAGVAAFGLASCQNAVPENGTAQNEGGNAALECIMTRTSVRSYTDQAVDSTEVEILLRAAMAAPTAGNKQPWRFVVIDSREMLDSIASAQKNMGMAAGAPLAILVCGDMEATFEGEGHDFWIEDTSAAAENLLLAAHATGLGGVWCGVYPSAERVDYFRRLTALPDSIVPMGLMVIGHPAGESTPKDKWKPEYIHYNRY